MFEQLAIRNGRAVRGLALALVSGGAALALAGCNAVTSQGAASGGGAAAAGSSAGSTTAAGGGAQASGAPAVAVGRNNGGECTLADLAISLGTAFPNGAPGVVQRPLLLKNTGSAACFVVGWPGVAALDGGGAQIFQGERVGTKG